MITAPSVQMVTDMAGALAPLHALNARLRQAAEVIERAMAASPLVKKRRAHQAKTAANLAALIAGRRNLRQITAETCTPSAPKKLTANTPELVLHLHQGNAPNGWRDSDRLREATPI